MPAAVSSPGPLDTTLVDEHEAARILGVATQTLRIWRSTGRYSLPFKKIGRSVRYMVADLERFIDSRSVTSTGQADQLDS